MMSDPGSKEKFLDDPDVRLMLDFCAGNKQAFEQLMTKHYTHILNFIYKHGIGREASEDLTQEVFIRVYQCAATYKAQAKFLTWLFTIARNISLNELRRLRKKTVSLDEPVTEDGSLLSEVVEDKKIQAPGNALMEEERSVSILKAIHELPENQKTAVILRRYEDLSYDEIAQTMGLSVKAIKSLLNRAKENLRDKLAHLLE